MLIKKQLEIVAQMLAFLESNVRLSNSVHFFDLNTASENFCVQFLNLIWSTNLHNRNVILPNADTVDLEDRNARIAVQVTSDNSAKKISDTITSFVSKGYESDFDTLRCLLLTPKKDYRTSFPTCKASIEILDLQDCMRTIQGLSPETLARVCDFLQSQFGHAVGGVFSLKTREVDLGTLAEDELGRSLHNALASVVPVHDGNRDLWCAVESLIFEVLRNAAGRSGSKKARLKVSTKALEISYDGAEFDPYQLLIATTKRGGYEALSNFLGSYDHLLRLGYQYSTGNHLSLVRESKNSRQKDINPCRVVVESRRPGDVKLKYNSSCRRKFLRVEVGDYHPSNFYTWFIEAIEKLGKPYEEIVFSVPRGNSYVDRMLLERFPGLSLRHYDW